MKIVWADPSEEVIRYPKRDFKALSHRVNRRKRFVRIVIGTLVFLVALGILAFIAINRKTKTLPEKPVSSSSIGPITQAIEPFDWSVIESIETEQVADITTDQAATEEDPIIVKASNYPDTLQNLVGTVKQDEALMLEDSVIASENQLDPNETSQSSDPSTDSSKKSFVPSEFIRAYPSVGYDSLYRYLTEYINKELLGSSNEADTVRISFAIETDGHPSGIKLSINTSDSIFMRIEEIVKDMPVWEPATADGEPIKTRFRLPLVIQSRTIKEE